MSIPQWLLTEPFLILYSDTYFFLGNAHKLHRVKLGGAISRFSYHFEDVSNEKKRERDFDNDAYGCRQIAVDHRNQNFHSLLDTPVVSMPQFQNVFVFISLFYTNSFSLFNLFFVQCQSINSWQRSIATFPNQTMFLLHQNFFSFNWRTHVSVLDVEISGGSFRILLQRRKANEIF